MPTVSLDAPIPATTIERVAARSDADARTLSKAVDDLHASLVDGSDAILERYETTDAPESVAVADGLAAVVFVDDQTWLQTLDAHDVPDALRASVRAVHAAFAAEVTDADARGTDGDARGTDANARGADAVHRDPLVLPSRTVGELVRVGLSTRQAEVQVLHDAGLDYATIAERLDVAESTVKVHRHRIQEKVANAKRLLDVVED
ncbi:helix-turn-helix transcriptional regulator [Halorubellus salinus]|uniref:helix-turn-helix transcriptional regulator n=1 Tax=Halorubellus salinus TaxID=755309 RepID=UPI001D08F1AB|nr:LuxR C-terminal-related transcriptional regulator [Halorubellus salinus]